MQTKTVYLIDGITRLTLPETQWGVNVLGFLIAQGRSIQISDQDPESDPRPLEEKLRGLAILNEAGQYVSQNKMPALDPALADTVPNRWIIVEDILRT